MTWYYVLQASDLPHLPVLKSRHQFFTVEITATNAHGYSAAQRVAFQVLDMPPSVIGELADLEVDHLRPVLVPVRTTALFQSNIRDDLLTVAVGLWDRRPLPLPNDPPEAANATARLPEDGDSLLPLPAFLAYDPAAQRLAGTPMLEDSGEYNIAVRATDSAGRMAEVRQCIFGRDKCHDSMGTGIHPWESSRKEDGGIYK